METYHDKIYMAIFVTALMPGPTVNFTLLSQGDLKFVFGDGPNKPPTLSIGGSLFLSLTMYDLNAELAALLGRPQRLFSNVEIDTSLVLTPERFGSVNGIFVVSKKDKSLVKDFQLWMIKNNPPNHVEYIQNSDHMVMISRPLDLGACLLSLAKKFDFSTLAN
ncbi:hypothetical protein CARUB_v10016042mg [Capsella rubella]|uniref:Uncharacterized protein n=1 Tax=Capsella rubella TaxID=81985 RepID=R0GAJ9_9BRAS|nr:hypothetical protein CARUB_v10016042mg [Capsella rubella]